MSSAKTDPATPARSPGNVSRPSAAFLGLLLGVVVAVAGGIWTDKLAPLPNPLTAITGWQWWFTPIERNAFLRLPVIHGNIYAADLQRGSLWIAGERGLLLGTRDGGRTWLRGSIADDAPPPQPGQKAAAWWEVLPLAHAGEVPNPVQQGAPYEQATDPKAIDDQANQPPNDPKPSPVQSNARGSGSQARPATGVAAPERPRPEPPATIDPTQQNLYGIHFLSAKEGIAIGANGTLLRTADGGTEWLRVPLEVTADLRAVAMTKRGRTLVAGARGVLLISDDRGVSWRTRPQAVSVDFSGLAVLGTIVAAVTRSGSVLVSTDGGETWQARAELSGANAVIAMGEASFLAIGAEGAVLRSDDRGGSWIGSKLDTAASLVAASSVDAQRVLAISSAGELFSSADGGQRWRQRAELPQCCLRVLVSDGQRTVAAGAAGALFESPDQGEQWQAIAASRSLLHAMSVADATRGIIVGDRGVILLTRDGGRSWTPRLSGTTADLLGVDFATRQRAMASGPKGKLLLTTDGGMDWSTLDVPKLNPMAEVAFADAKHAIVVGRSEAPSSIDLFATRDGGETWSTRPLPIAGDTPLAVGFADTQHALVANTGGAALSRDAGQSWQPVAGLPKPISAIVPVTVGRYRTWVFVPQGSENAQWIIGETRRTIAAQPWRQAMAGAFFNATDGMIVGRNGTILRTTDGGTTWSPRPSGTVLDLNAVRYFAAERLAAMASSRVFLSEDGGDSWSPMEYGRYPSPWLWLAAALLLATAGWQILARTRRPQIAEQRVSILDAAASDRPIGWHDPDPAGLRDIALGLSSFLRNRRTEPPLTIAVTGEWGTGKSSLMNLLRHDLQRAGFRPVWFNAWHHQSGENLLGSLLANIHAQAVPPLHTLAGWDFRLTLLTVRAKRFWLRLALTLFAIATLLFCYNQMGASAGKFLQALLDNDTSVLESFRNAAGLLGFLAAMLMPVLGAIRAGSAFGLQPGKLIAAVATASNDELSRQQAGARYRFAREFADFTRALDPRTLVIFIDDLDRCRPENVAEVLEAVNFLINSGRCVIVLGMAKRWVETCVGLAFKELAMAESQTDSSEDRVAGTASNEVTSDGKEQRQFARNYLEKLINIEIRVPKLSKSAARAILQGHSAEPPKSGFRYALGNVLLQALPIAAWLVSAGLIIYAAANVAGRLNALTAVEPVTSVAPLTQPSQASPNIATSPREEAANATPASPPSGDIVFEAAEAHASSVWYLGAGVPVGLTFLAFIAVLLFARKEVRTDDSPAFRAALVILQPWILLGGHSPRSLKRFINHLRYIAMRFRSTSEAKTRWERVRERIAVWFGREPSRTPTAEPIRGAPPEEVLVALAAIYRCHERWLEELTPWREEKLAALIERDYTEQIPDEVERQQIVQQLVSAIEDFNRHFPASRLFVDPMSDRRYIIAFHDVMAAETAARPAEEPPAAAQLRPMSA